MHEVRKFKTHHIQYTIVFWMNGWFLLTFRTTTIITSFVSYCVIDFKGAANYGNELTIYVDICVLANIHRSLKSRFRFIIAFHKFFFIFYNIN